MEQFNVNESQLKKTREDGSFELQKVEISDIATARLEELVGKAIREGRLTFIVTDDTGLHMRPADQLVRATNKSGCQVELVRPEDVSSAPTRGDSILSIAMLALNCKEAVTVSAKGGNLTAFWSELLTFDFWQVRE